MWLVRESISDERRFEGALETICTKFNERFRLTLELILSRAISIKYLTCYTLIFRNFLFHDTKRRTTNFPTKYKAIRNFRETNK